MKLEKVYDELYGMIEDLKKQIAALSGGDEVTITPALESGTKVADYTIGETEGSLFAPTAPGVAYSTTEQVVGSLGTTPLYSRIFEGSWTQSSTTPFDWLVTDISAATEGIENVFSVIAETATGTVDVGAEIQINSSGYLQFSVASARTFTKLYVLYTKPAPSPEPENNTKKRRTK